MFSIDNGCDCSVPFCGEEGYERFIVYVYMCMSPRIVPGSCKLPDMGAINKTEVLYKNSVHSLPVNHISRSDCPLVYL